MTDIIRSPIGEVENPDYGWERYERTLWINDAGQKCYFGHFVCMNDPYGFTRVTIKFWANRPVIAMRAIAQSNDPLSFAGKAVN